jgi:hypothetical protein
VAKAKELTEQQQIVALLQYLVAIQLWTSGLSQDDIRRRLGIGSHAVNDMLKGVARSNPVKGNV